MKIRDLIAELSRLDPDAEVITISGPCDDAYPAMAIQPHHAVFRGVGDTRTVRVEYGDKAPPGSVTVYRIV